MLALGVAPAGIVAQASDFTLPGQAEALAGVTNVGSDAGVLDIEKALALNADLVLEIGESWNQEVCDRAKQAVATACFPYGVHDRPRHQAEHEGRGRSTRAAGSGSGRHRIV